ncbi:heme-dependent oxidative N-demethylase family protein [Pararhizobium sp.]|uniref:heme-dependent oxidative N-demethylase family protein n=1 Tax=Pararhizobium sp. TaxID=1977563 RepID=UPI00271FC7BC|nr:DUF3445 domain-containing protein [Pararhizobium sp.]MDO9415181.1 DUF3445 domain-containing protein [Pararhizobium sp.]
MSDRSPPIYTPYDGSAKPFTIGLTQLDPENWIEPDGDLDAYLSEKSRLLGVVRDQIFVEEDGTRDSQVEMLSLLSAYLPDRFPAIYKRDGTILQAGAQTIDLADPGTPPLILAGSLVQDDLVIMRRKETGWHLVAGYVAFPSSWRLVEKFGRSMDEIHDVVPGFQGGTRNAELINRMFDSLQVGRLVRRFNWSINPDGELYHPRSKALGAVPGVEPLRLNDAFVRVERQTLCKLPGSGDIVFTIRIYTDPLAMLESHADGARIATALADQLTELDQEQTAYKGFTARRDELIAALRSTAGG